MSVGDEPRPIKNVGEPRPYGSSLINCFRQGSAAEPDESPAYQNTFGESENEADQYSPGEPSSGPPIALGPGKGKLYMWKEGTPDDNKADAATPWGPWATKTRRNPALQQQGQQSSMARAKPKQRKITGPKAKAKTKAKTKAKKAKAKPKSKAKAKATPKSKTKPKGRSAKKEEAMLKMWKKCQGAKVMRQHKNQPMRG